MAMYALPQAVWTFPAAHSVVTLPNTAPTLKPVNDIPLTRTLLKQVLSDLSERLYRSFRRQVRLVVHGGAVMVLHPYFTHRESTQDVDYVHRSFVSEYRALGFLDAEQRLRACIAETAYRFNLGADWMNDHADVALPLALDQHGRQFDPIFYASTTKQNAGPQTIFNERGLALTAVPWPWAIALKLVRYAKKDPEDCAAILRLGYSQRGIRWTVAGLEQWISDRCWPMQYANYQASQRAQLRERLQDAIARAFPEPSPTQSQPQPQLQLQSRPRPMLHPSASSSSLLVFAPVQRTKSDSIPLYFL